MTITMMMTMGEKAAVTEGFRLAFRAYYRSYLQLQIMSLPPSFLWSVKTTPLQLEIK
jgi:hypothetical protein